MVKYIREEADRMEIAVAYENGMIFQHFGHTKNFKIYKINDNQIVSSEMLNTTGSGHSALARLLKDHGIDVLICGGIEGGAQNALAETGIKQYGVFQGMLMMQ